MKLIDADLLLNDLPCKKVMYMCLNIDVCHGYNSCIDSVTKCIKEQPTVNEWVPCSERLPDKYAYYSATVKEINCADTNVRPILFDRFGFATSEYQEVIAWQPLPEPYEVQNESR